MTALTSTAIDALAPGQRLKDDRVSGLEVRCHGSGRSFLLYYRTRYGVARRPKIGDYGAITIAQARDIARNMLAEVAAGGDPSRARAAARTEPTMDELWGRCEREHYNRGKKWDYEARRLYRTCIKPKLGGDRVSAIRYEDCKKVHSALAGRPTMANKAVSVLSAMLTEAERWGYRPEKSNPCELVKRNKERERRRYAKPNEIKDIAAVLAREAKANPRAAAFLYLLIFSGARPSEIAKAEPGMLDRMEKDGLVFGALRIEDGKTGERVVYLPPQAMAVIDQLPAEGIPIRRGKGCGPRTITGLAGVPRKLWARIRNAVGAPDLWARDWRRTFGTVALSNGVSLGKVGELLGHADPRTTKIYAKLLEDEAHANAAKVAGHLSTLMAAE